MEEVKSSHKMVWPTIATITIVIFGLVGIKYTEQIKERNSLERERIASEERIQKEKLEQEQRLTEKKLENDRVADTAKLEAQTRESAAIQQRYDDQKDQKYRQECRSEKSSLIKLCNTGLSAPNGYIYTKCGDDTDCISAEILKNPFCPKADYDVTCLSRKRAGLPTYSE